MFVVYVIESSEGYRYTGFTTDIEKRLNQHNHGISFWTKRGTNWKVIYTETFQDKKEALKRERWLKSGKGRQFLKTLLSSS